MSGWSTQKEAERIIRETVKRVDPLKTGLSNDPRDYWMKRLYDYVLIGAPHQGWRIVSHDEGWFHLAMGPAPAVQSQENDSLSQNGARHVERTHRK